MCQEKTPSLDRLVRREKGVLVGGCNFSKINNIFSLWKTNENLVSYYDAGWAGGFSKFFSSLKNWFLEKGKNQTHFAAWLCKRLLLKTFVARKPLEREKIEKWKGEKETNIEKEKKELNQKKRKPENKRGMHKPPRRKHTPPNRQPQSRRDKNWRVDINGVSSFFLDVCTNKVAKNGVDN